MKKTPIEVFGEWVSMGKDEGMEKNHEESRNHNCPWVYL